MSNYKRLTKQKITSENTKIVYNENGFAIFEKKLVKTLLAEHNRLWELENQRENGTLIELPCKVGDKVYRLCGTPKKRYIKEKTCQGICFNNFGIIPSLNDNINLFGNTCFLDY